jgi:putative transposase
MTTAVAPSSSVSPRVQLTARQRVCLEQITRRQTIPQRLVRRANIILALDTGAHDCHITRQLHLNRGTVRAWRQRWLALTAKLERLEAEGGSDKVLTTVIVESLTDQRRAGAPATFTAEQIVQIIAVACETPVDSGRPISHWTPREVADEVRKRGIVETISTRSVGRFLKSGRFTAASGGVRAQCQTR